MGNRSRQAIPARSMRSNASLSSLVPTIPRVLRFGWQPSKQEKLTPTGTNPSRSSDEWIRTRFPWRRHEGQQDGPSCCNASKRLVISLHRGQAYVWEYTRWCSIAFPPQRWQRVAYSHCNSSAARWTMASQRASKSLISIGKRYARAMKVAAGEASIPIA